MRTRAQPLPLRGDWLELCVVQETGRGADQPPRAIERIDRALLNSSDTRESEGVAIFYRRTAAHLTALRSWAGAEGQSRTHSVGRVFGDKASVEGGAGDLATAERSDRATGRLLPLLERRTHVARVKGGQKADSLHREVSRSAPEAWAAAACFARGRCIFRPLVTTESSST